MSFTRAEQKTGIYLVFDKISQKRGPLFEQVNDGTAIRAYKKLLGEHSGDASDYVLQRVGDRLESGLIQGFLIPVDVFVFDNLEVKVEVHE